MGATVGQEESFLDAPVALSLSNFRPNSCRNSLRKAIGRGFLGFSLGD
jgi:hypothetical protein